MSSYKDPGFQERATLAKQAKQKALDQLRAKPPVDEAVLAERRAARLAREEAEAEKRRAKRESEEQAKAARLAQKQAAPAPVPSAPALSEADRKAARDARYAARKNRKKS